jgi:hypothetical protein
MNTVTIDEDLVWLHERHQSVSATDEQFYCRMVRNQMTLGWRLMDARNYAFGRMLGFQTWMKPRVRR